MLGLNVTWSIGLNKGRERDLERMRAGSRVIVGGDHSHLKEAQKKRRVGVGWWGELGRRKKMEGGQKN